MTRRSSILSVLALIGFCAAGLAIFALRPPSTYYSSVPTTTPMTQVAGAVPPLCSALVDIDSDLYLVSSANRPEVRFTSNHAAKHSVSLSPDANKVAFVLEQSIGSFTVVDVGGRRKSYDVRDLPSTQADSELNQYLQNQLDGVWWDKENTLQTARRISPDRARFDFYEVPEDVSSGFMQPANRAGAGELCTAGHQTFSVACLDGNDVSVDGETIYVKKPDQGPQPWDTVTLHGDTAATNSLNPQFQIQVTSLAQGITLRITLPGGNWTQSRVDPGDYMAVPFESEVFNFFPSIANSTNREVKVSIFKGAPITEPSARGISWRRDENSVGVLERSNHQTKLVLLHKKPFQSNYYKLAEYVLNIQESLSAIRFTKHSTLAFETDQRFGEIEFERVSQGWFDPAVLKFGRTVSFPRTLNVDAGAGLAARKVYDWSCTTLQ